MLDRDNITKEFCSRTVLRIGAVGSGLLGLSSVSETGAQEGPTTITDCGSIDEPGEYVLGDDLSAEGDCLRINASDVTLDGNGRTLDGDGTGTGLHLEFGGSTVRNLTIQNFDAGVVFGPSSGFELSSITIQDNNRNGVWCQGTRGVLCKDSTIRQNEGIGVSLSDYTSDVILRNCDVVQNARPLRAGSSAIFSIEDCRIVDNGGPVSFAPRPESEIEGTLVSGSDGAGLRTNHGDLGIYDEPMPVTNCVIRDCNGAGIEQPTGSLNVRECTLSGNRIGYEVDGSTDPYKTTLRYSNIEDNEEYGVLHTRADGISTTIDATCNWWGDESGPVHEDTSIEDPQGQRVSSHVEYVPWSIERIEDGEGVCEGDPTDPTQEEMDPTPPSNQNIQSRLAEATVLATVTIDNRDYYVLQEIPEEPDDRFAYADDEFRLLEPDAAINVAMSYRYCDAYTADNQQRLEYTNNQHDQYSDIETMARGANLASELSGAIALAKLSPTSAASNAVDAVQAAVEWGVHELTDPYHRQFAKMAATADTVTWADQEVPNPGGSLLGATDEVFDIVQAMLLGAEAAEGIEDITEAAGTIREIFRQADSIRDGVSPEAIDGVDDLRNTAYTAIAGLAVDVTVDSVAGVAEGQARAAALGSGQAAARRPLLTELIELEERVETFDLGPAGILRMQALHQTDYQIEAAGLYGQAAVIEAYQSSQFGSALARYHNTEDLPATFRAAAETFRDLSSFRAAATGQLLEEAIADHRESLNAVEYEDQDLLEAR